jgi:hypothetical protein
VERSQTILIPVLAVLVLLLADNGLSAVSRNPHAMQTFTDTGSSRLGQKQLLIVIPGYNGNGRSITRSLRAAGLSNTDIVSFCPPYWGYDSPAVSLALAQEINHWKNVNQRTHNDNLVVNAYVESLGGQQLVEMLRAFRDIHIHRVVMGAVPFGWRNTSFGSFIQVARVLYGGPILTQALRLWHRIELRNAPSAIQVSPLVVNDAHKASMRLTAMMLMDQLRLLINYTPPRRGELDNRIDQVIYLCGPDHADPLVQTTVSAGLWAATFGGTRVQFIVTRTGAWTGLHAPSTERPGPVVEALMAA